MFVLVLCSHHPGLNLRHKETSKIPWVQETFQAYFILECKHAVGLAQQYPANTEGQPSTRIEYVYKIRKCWLTTLFFRLLLGDGPVISTWSSDPREVLVIYMARNYLLPQLFNTLSTGRPFQGIEHATFRSPGQHSIVWVNPVTVFTVTSAFAPGTKHPAAQEKKPLLPRVHLGISSSGRKTNNFSASCGFGSCFHRCEAGVNWKEPSSQWKHKQW